MKRLKLALGLAVVASIATGNAHAALIGVTQSYPDVSLAAAPTLIYNHAGVDANTGRLIIVAGASTLTASSGGPNVTQSYLADGVPDVILTINVNNTTGALVSGSVTIGFGDSTTNPRWSWQGTVTQFGFASPGSNGTIFDARWNMSSDQYQNMPTTMSQFVNGYLTGRNGGLDILSTATWGTAANFGNDWIYGTNPSASNLSTYTAGMSNPIRTTSTVNSDIFVTPSAVPLPAGIWLLVSGLAALAPVARRGVCGSERRGAAQPA